MIYVGTCGFSESMNKYFRDFNTVEVQQTFYKILELKVAEKWKKKAPKDFVFNIKAFQGITHPSTSPTWKRSNVDVSNFKDKVGFLRPTKEVYGFWRKNLDFAKILEAKVIVLQLPSSFKETEENWSNAERFFENLERENFEIGVEIRGWSPESIKRLCKKFDLVDVCDLFLREPFTKKTIYTRLHGKYEKEKINYYYKYTKEDLEKLKNKIKSLKFRSAFVYFNNIFMLENSKEFLSIL